jgi:hypothetical protein
MRLSHAASNVPALLSIPRFVFVLDFRFCPRLEPRSREALFVSSPLCRRAAGRFRRFFRGNERKLARSHYLIAKRFGPSLLVFVLSSYLSQC